VTDVEKDARHLGIAWLLPAGKQAGSHVEGAKVLRLLASERAQLSFRAKEPCPDAGRSDGTGHLLSLAYKVDRQIGLPEVREYVCLLAHGVR
jgi:hypothetical protein